MAGVFSIQQQIVYVLFDTGSTLSFISKHIAPYCDLNIQPLIPPIKVETPIGSSEVNQVARNVEITMNGRAFPSNLILLPMKDIDIILGMDWLLHYHANIDCT